MSPEYADAFALLMAGFWSGVAVGVAAVFMFLLFWVWLCDTRPVRAYSRRFEAWALLRAREAAKRRFSGS